MSSLVAPDPPAGLSSGLRPLYAEAVSVADASPASASALLRMLIQTLIKGQGLRGRDLVKDIGTLVERGAPVGLLRALDVIGMTEHESRHPAELSLANGHSDAQNLFMFVNLFVTQILGT